MTSSRRLISVVTPCYNEEGNARELYAAVKEIFSGLPSSFAFVAGTGRSSW